MLGYWLDQGWFPPGQVDRGVLMLKDAWCPALPMGRWFLFLYTILVWVAFAQASDVVPSDAPFVRIETGQHMASVNQLSRDTSGRFVVTASDDKTVRLWTLSDGKLLDTLRVPIGSGLEGALYTAAVSPDGHTLVAAGYTCVSWDNAACIYLFDLETHTLKARLTSLPAVVTHLAYSPDGKAIVGTMGGTAGIRVWNSTNGKMVMQDSEYTDSATFFTFNNTGRLAVVSMDGFIRLYDASYTRILKASLPKGNKPHTVAFSPDGKWLAVGYENSTKVSVLNANNLSFAYSPNVSGLVGSFGAVAWIERGGELLLAAAGTASDANKRYIIRFWSKAGLGVAHDVPVAGDVIMDLEAAVGGKLLFASAEPAWGLVNPVSGVDFVNHGMLNDFRDIAEGRFSVSNDGMVVDFGTLRGGKRPFRFDARQQELTIDPPQDASLTNPLVHHTSVVVTDWKNNPAPKLNGKPLLLDKGEYALSLAIDPDGTRFLVGGDYGLHLFAANGQPIKSQALPGAAWGVNLSRDGKLAVVALGDGSIRWYSLAKGKELEEVSALFVVPEGNRWVSWIPEGFFNHSSGGGEKLIGYHVNHGKSKSPEFVSIEQTYQVYYSPHLVSLKLQGDPNGEIALRMKDSGNVGVALTTKAPPKVAWIEYCLTVPGGAANDCHSITSEIIPSEMASRDYRRDNQAKTASTAQAPSFVAELPPGTEAVRLRFKVTDQGGGVGGMDVLQNARIAGTTRDYRRAAAPAPAANDGVVERTIAVQLGENNVQLKVFDGNNGNYGVSSFLGFRVAAPPQTAGRSLQTVEEKPKPRLFLLSAGINEYAGDARLSFPVSDARAFFDYLKDHPNPVYSGGVIGASFLKDGEVTGPSIAAAFDKIKALKPGENDRVVVYLSGHGTFEPKEGGYFFITYDADHATQFSYKLALGQQEFLNNMIKVSTAGGILLILDTCHSGAGVSSIVDASRTTEGQLEGVSKVGQSLGDKVLVLSAASSSETAADVYKGQEANEYSGQHGPFSVAVLKGLAGDGSAADKEGNVNAVNFGMYVSKKLRELAKENNHPQKANFKTASDLGDSGDFFLTTVPTHR